MNTRFVLVRHATCALTDQVLLGRAIDAPLDSRGESQARALAQRLAPQRPALVQASPRRRAQQTAAAIAAHACCDLQTAAELDELDFGAWSGRTFAALDPDPQWQRWNAQRSTSCTPAGDNIAQVQQRIVAHLRALAPAFNGCTVVLVTHAEVIRAALLHFLRAPIDDYHRIEIAPASQTALRLRDGSVSIESINAPAAMHERVFA